jgi:FkbM family methyltransferase
MMIAIPGVARRIIERAMRDRVIKRHLPSEFGARPIYVSPDAALRYLLPGASGFDQSLLALADRYVRPQSVVWDIGANVGAFTFPAAVRASEGHVLSVEPDPFLVSLLRRTAGLRGGNDLDVRIVPAAISKIDGVTELTLAARGRAANTISGAFVGSQRGGSRGGFTVPTLRLDTLLNHYAPPHLVKIDVEGAEAFVLEGAKKLLTDARPILFIEVASENEEQVRNLLTAARYRFFDGADLRAGEPRTERCEWATLAKPIEAAG